MKNLFYKGIKLNLNFIFDILENDDLKLIFLNVHIFEIIFCFVFLMNYAFFICIDVYYHIKIVKYGIIVVFIDIQKKSNYLYLT